jgi:hypothetical protein
MYTDKTANQNLTALVWAAKQQGISYGQFMMTLTESEKREIYRQYARYLKKKPQIIKAHLMMEKAEYEAQFSPVHTVNYVEKAAG